MKIETFFPDHFSQADRLAVFAGLLFSAFAAYVLLQAKPVLKSRTKKPIARFESFTNNVRHKESGSVSFYEVHQKEELENSDEIFTGEGSIAHVRFLNSKTILKIPSSSLIKIEEGENGESIEVKDGVVDIVVGKNQAINLQSNGVTHQISSSQKDSVIKAYYGMGELHLFTQDSGVKIKDANGESELTSNQDEIAGAKKSNGPTSFLLLSPIPGEKLGSAGGIIIKTNLTSKYNVSLSKHVNFSSPVFTAKFTGTSLNWDIALEEGDYFLKIEDKANKKIIPVTLVSKYKIDGFKPNDGELIEITPPEKIVLQWNPVPAKSYKVVVRENHGEGKPYYVNTNKLELSNLKASQIDWMVFPEVSENKYSNIKKSNSLRVKYNGKIELVGVAGKSNYKINDTKFTLSWKAQAGNQFLVKAFDINSNSDLFTKQVSDKNISIPITSIGSYKIEVSSLDYPNFQKAEYTYDVNSPILSWDTKLLKEVKSTEEDEEILLSYKESLDLSSIAHIHMKYAPSPPGKLVDSNIKFVRKNRFTKIKLLGFGQYCLKAELNSPVKYYFNSDVHCFKLIQLPVFPIVPKAKDSIMAFTKKNGIVSYKVQVPKLEKAAKYQLEIYLDKLGKKLIYSTSTNEPEFLWTTNRSGIYYLKYKVYDKKNRGSDYSPLSKLIFPISPLADW